MYPSYSPRCLNALMICCVHSRVLHPPSTAGRMRLAIAGYPTHAPLRVLEVFPVGCRCIGHFNIPHSPSRKSDSEMGSRIGHRLVTPEPHPCEDKGADQPEKRGEAHVRFTRLHSPAPPVPAASVDSAGGR